MLKPAQLYKEVLHQKLLETWYDEKYKYFYDTNGKQEMVVPDNCYYQRYFVSLDKKNNLLGYIVYTYDDNSSYAKWFGIMCFEDSYCYEFIADVLRVIDDIFEKFSLNRIEFQCFTGNPACEAYRRFIRKYGGREACTLRQTTKLMDGTLCDSVIFEVLYIDLIWDNENNCTKLHTDRLRIDRMMNKEEKK